MQCPRSDQKTWRGKGISRFTDLVISFFVDCSIEKGIYGLVDAMVSCRDTMERC